MSNSEQQFIALSYHYIRSKNDPFPRILGNDSVEFQNHIKMIKNNYPVISPNEVQKFYYNKKSFRNSKNILFTFDDGLSEHFEVAKILCEYDIQALFCIPTCIIDEKLPANPMIIHYCIAEFGVGGFLKKYHNVIEDLKISNNKNFELQYDKGIDNIWEKINQIKDLFKYKIGNELSRKILIRIFQELFLQKYPTGLDIIHLNENKIKKMIKMGHTIGTHSHTHISISTTKLNQKDFEKEMIYPKKILEKKFGVDINSLSYTFGSKKDCLSSIELLERTKEYKIAFTAEQISNTKKTSPLELGRYIPNSTDTTKKLSLIIEKIWNKF